MSSQEETLIDEHQQKLKGIKRQMTYANGMLEHELETASQNCQSSINRNNSFTLKPDSNHVPTMLKDASTIENKYLQVESDTNQALHVLHRSEEIENLSSIQNDSIDNAIHLKRTPEVENLNEFVEI